GLLAVGVLELIHQDVIELALEARADFGTFAEQAGREFFEVREIEQAGGALPLAVGAVEAAGEVDEQPAVGGVMLCEERIRYMPDLLTHVLEQCVGGIVPAAAIEIAFELLDRVERLQRGTGAGDAFGAFERCLEFLKLLRVPAGGRFATECVEG